MPRMRFQCGAHSWHRAVHEISTGTAMHMDVDEPRADVTTLGIHHDRMFGRGNVFTDGFDLAAFAQHLTACHQAVRQDEGAVLD